MGSSGEALTLHVSLVSIETVRKVSIIIGGQPYRCSFLFMYETK
jgi:hypothetical protein